MSVHGRIKDKTFSSGSADTHTFLTWYDRGPYILTWCDRAPCLCSNRIELHTFCPSRVELSGTELYTFGPTRVLFTLVW